jgi:hypothetical protein
MSGCSLSSLFRDKTGLWKLSQSQTNDLGGVSNLENILSGDDATQWLVVMKIGGILEVWQIRKPVLMACLWRSRQIVALPSCEFVFSSHELRDLAPCVTDIRGESQVRLVTTDSEPSAEITKLVIAPVGEGACHPHLVVRTDLHRTTSLVNDYPGRSSRKRIS